MSMEKISAAQIDHVMVKAAAELRSLSAENETLRLELASRDRRDHAEKIASVAVDRGIMAEEDAAEYASELSEGSDNLDLVESFVSRRAAGVPLGKSLEKVAHDTEGGDGAPDVLTTFLLSSDYAG